MNFDLLKLFVTNMRYSFQTFVALTFVAVDASFDQDLARSGTTSSGNSNKGLLSSASATFQNLIRSGLSRSGALSDDSSQTAAPLGLLGLCSGSLNQLLLIETEVSREGTAWGNSETEARKGRLNTMPSDTAMADLRERVARDEQYVAKQDRSLVESIEALGPMMVYNVDQPVVIPSGEEILREGRAFIRRELLACKNGWLDNKVEPLVSVGSMEASERAPSEKSRVDHPDWPMGELLGCLQARGKALPNLERKLVISLEQIQTDMDRSGLLDNIAAPEADLGTIEALWTRIYHECEEISSLWLIQVVPWFKFLQASADPCFYLRARKGLELNQVMEGLIVFRDKITRHSRYPDERYYEYNQVLAAYWGRLLMRYFPETFDGLIDDGFFRKLSSFLLRPAMDSRTQSKAIPNRYLEPLWDFVFANGRPGLWALYIASVQHGRDSYNDFMLAYNQLRVDGADRETKDARLRQVMRVPEDHPTPSYLDGEYDWDLNGPMILEKPISFWFGYWEVDTVLEKAQRVLSTRYGRTGAPPKSNMLAKLRKASARTPVSEEVENVSFETLVDMIDIIVDDRMSESSRQFRSSKRQYSESATSAVMSLQLGLDLVVYDDSMEDIYPSMEAVKKSGEILSTNEAIEDADSSEDLRSLIEKNEPFTIYVNGVKRELPYMEYEEMLYKLEHIVELCQSVDNRDDDLRRAGGATSIIRRNELISGKENWYLTRAIDCLIEKRENLDPILEGYLGALVKIREATGRRMDHNGLSGQLMEKIVTQDCEEILAVYAIGFAHSPSAILNGKETLEWCVELKRITLEDGLTPLLSNFEVLKAISVIANKITRVTSFGSLRVEEYSKILANYLMSAYESANPVRESLLASFERTERLSTLKTIATTVPYVACDPLDKGFFSTTRNTDFWITLFREGRRGFVAMLYAQMIKSIPENGHLASFGLHRAEHLATLVPAVLDTHIKLSVSDDAISFANFVKIIDTLVDSVMIRRS